MLKACGYLVYLNCPEFSFRILKWKSFEIILYIDNKISKEGNIYDLQRCVQTSCVAAAGSFISELYVFILLVTTK